MTSVIIKGAAALLAVMLVTAGFYGLLGIGSQRGESQYTGYVVDVVDDKGIVFKPSWVNVKTHPRSSSHEQFCILTEDKDDFLPVLRDALHEGHRVSITYERPLWVDPKECDQTHSIVTGVTVVNETSDS